jgi:hypothetical protein
MISDAANPRISIENLGMSTLFSIPARKNWITLIFLGVWLTGWLFGELFALGVLFSSLGSFLFRIFNIRVFDIFEFDGGIGSAFAGVFILVWLTMWTVGGYGAGRTFLWQLAGREVVEVSRTSIKLSRPIFGLGRVKEYQAAEIADLRLLRGDGRAGKKSMAGPNQLGFDYEFDTVEFGGGLTGREAEAILEEITKRYRQYAPSTIE